MDTPIPMPFMMNYSFGDVVLIEFPYTNGAGAKKRPALVLYDAADPDLVVARITSQPGLSSADLILKDWTAAGLLVSSTVRLHKVATLHKDLVVRVLGHLSVIDKLNVTTHLQSAALAM